MAKRIYDLHLKGFVGSADFDRNAVDNLVDENMERELHVLIDSLGGNLATGLSISNAFKRHGAVSVHFVGLNASAATIASLGASHISIDSGAMYLVHKCSLSFFEWGSLNADQLADLIADCEKMKSDLEKLDANVAGLYASRCKRDVKELLDLMKEGGWLTAQEALEWGFVDEITDVADEEKPELTDAMASAMASAGIPIPDLPVKKPQPDPAFSGYSAFSRFLNDLMKFLKNSFSITNSIHSSMKKSFKFLCAAIGVADLELADGSASLTEGQLDAIEARMAEADEKTASLQSEIDSLKARIEELEAEPGDSSTPVVASSRSNPEASPYEAYVEKCNRARQLFNQFKS